MQISDIQVYTADVPFNKPHRTAYHEYDTIHQVFVKITTDEGAHGFGEAGAHMDLGISQSSIIEVLRRYTANKLLGQDPLNIGELVDMVDMPKTREQARAGRAVAAIDIALHDLAGKILGIPVHLLLGGRFREELVVGATIRIEPPKEAAEDAKRLVQKGFKRLKVKAGLNPREDIERVKAIRESVGPDIGIWIDPNEQWNSRIAIKTIREMERYGVDYVEQPVPGWDLSAMAEVRREVSPCVQTIADQSVFTIYDVLQIVENEAADIISLKVNRMGLHEARKMACIAESAGLNCKLGASDETGLQCAAGMHLSASIGNFDVCTSEVALPRLRTTLVDGLVPSDGFGRIWKIPKGPGLGVSMIEKDLTPVWSARGRKRTLK